MFGGAVAIIAFWTFLTAVTVGGMVMRYMSQREVQKTIRALAQSGQTIDPAALEPLIGRAGVTKDIYAQTPYEQGRRLILPAAILTAIGPGLAIMGFFIGLQAGGAIYPLYGVGALVMLIGLGMGGYAFWLMKTYPPGGPGSERW